MTQSPLVGRSPDLLALDLESVLVPEIWEVVAEACGIPALRLTTRDVPVYDELMAHRVTVCRRNNVDLALLQRIIATIEPLPGAQEFLCWARSRGPVVLLSDTFYEFAQPLLGRLGYPLLLCNTLEVDDAGRLLGYRQRAPEGKGAAVRAFRGLGFRVAAVGDSFNDLAMLDEADQGILLQPPPGVVRRAADHRVVGSLDDLQAFLVGADRRSSPRSAARSRRPRRSRRRRSGTGRPGPSRGPGGGSGRCAR